MAGIFEGGPLDDFGGIGDLLGGGKYPFGGRTTEAPTAERPTDRSSDPIDNLVDVLTRTTIESNRAQLTKLVDSLPGTVEKIARPELTRAYARACVFLDRTDEAFDTYSRLESLDDGERAFLGLIFYQRGKQLMPVDIFVMQVSKLQRYYWRYLR